MSSENTKPQESLGSIEFSFKYPFTNKDSKYGGIMFGALMLVISFLVIPMFTFNGYIFRLKENAAKGEPEAPKFKNWKSLTVEGFYASIVLLVLILPAMLILFILGSLEEGILKNLSLILSIVTSLLVFAASPIVGVVYSVKRDIIATYTDPELYEVLFSLHYLISVLKYFLIALLLFLIYIFGAIITLGIGILVLVPLLMYVRPAFWGHVYYKKQNS